jgi:hypothetical protein
MSGKPFRLAAAIVLVAFGTGLFAQTPAPAPVPAATPYTADEFKGWMLDLRRFENISLGSLPFSVFFTRIGFDTYKYFATYDKVNKKFDAQYAPWPFKKTSAYVPSADEAKKIIVAAAGLSVILAIADFVILKLREKKKKTDSITIQDILKIQEEQGARNTAGGK